MIILWIRRNKRSRKDKDAEKEETTFQKHDEEMKDFRAAHEAPQRVGPEDILLNNESMLAPVKKVVPAKNIQN